MKVAIRADASVAIGSGHVMRCLTLAESLRSRGAEIAFFCRESTGNCNEIIAGRGFKVCGLLGNGEFDPEIDAELMKTAVADLRPDWIVVDHYGIGVEWERRLRPFAGRIMVIDDLADRHHDCDLLLDQNLIEGMASRYDSLIPESCHRFLGPEYVLLRDEFVEARSGLRNRDGAVRRILVFFGGSDPTNETGKALQSIRQLNRPDIGFDVVVGASNPRADEIRALSEDAPNIFFHCQVAIMATFMAKADLAVGAGGTATWERCFLGLPALLIVVADNQAAPATAAANAGLARLLGRSHDISDTCLARALADAIASPQVLKRMSGKCLALFGDRDSSVHREIMDCFFRGSDAA